MLHSPATPQFPSLEEGFALTLIDTHMLEQTIDVIEHRLRTAELKLADSPVTHDEMREYVISEVSSINPECDCDTGLDHEQVNDIIDSSTSGLYNDVNSLTRYTDGLDSRLSTLEAAVEDGDLLDSDNVRSITHDVFDSDVTELQARVESLTKQVQAQDSAIDSQLARIAALEAQLGSGNVVNSLTLFDLLTRAARILGILR
jgi:chaperonin cofactor prefoldin